VSVGIPAVLQNEANLAFIGQMLAWQQGDPTPEPPATMTLPLPEFVALLDDPDNRDYVVRRLSIFLRGMKAKPRKKR
jgi:hypothetical protein